MAKTTPKRTLPAELEGVARVEQLNTLEARVDKAFSQEDYKTFQEEVEAIVLKLLASEPAHDKLNSHLEAKINKMITDRGWKNKTFWIPTGIALVAAVAAVIAIFK